MFLTSTIFRSWFISWPFSIGGAGHDFQWYRSSIQECHLYKTEGLMMPCSRQIAVQTKTPVDEIFTWTLYYRFSIWLFSTFQIMASNLSREPLGLHWSFWPFLTRKKNHWLSINKRHTNEALDKNHLSVPSFTLHCLRKHKNLVGHGFPIFFYYQRTEWRFLSLVYWSVNCTFVFLQLSYMWGLLWMMICSTKCDGP